MERFSQKKIILLTLGLFTPLIFTTPKVNSGSFGAEIFCTMRDGGNDHESSWDAAYTYIKKQKGGIFKVSPKQAAAQILSLIHISEPTRRSYISYAVFCLNLCIKNFFFYLKISLIKNMSIEI